jgi:hypothetical protein
MPKCKNDPSKNYKGNEPSPKGLGFCAHAEKTGSKMKGLDGNQWIVKEDKNKIKRWYKYSQKSTTPKSTTPKEKTYDQLPLDMFYGFTPIPPKNINKLKSEKIVEIIIDKLIPKIKKNNIEAYLVPLPFSSQGLYWTDFPPDYIKQYYKSNLEKEYLYFIVYLNHDMTFNYDRNVAIHYEINKNNIEKIQNIFYQEIPNNYIWNGNIHNIMEISYQPIKNNSKSKIDNSSDYPNFYLSIYLNLKKKEPNLLNLGFDIKDIEELKSIKSKFNDLSWGMDDISNAFYGIKDFKIFEKQMKDLIKKKKITIKDYKYNIKKISVSGYMTKDDALNNNLYKIK